jgi:hypothetical protein
VADHEPVIMIPANRWPYSASRRGEDPGAFAHQA